MADRFVSLGFWGKRREPEAAKANRIPPGQYLTTDFAVLSAGPTPRTPLARWTFSIEGQVKESVSGPRRNSSSFHRRRSSSISPASPNGPSSTPNGKASAWIRSSNA
jgi:hypothetical protein